MTQKGLQINISDTHVYETESHSSTCSAFIVSATNSSVAWLKKQLILTIAIVVEKLVMRDKKL